VSDGGREREQSEVSRWVVVVVVMTVHTYEHIDKHTDSCSASWLSKTGDQQGNDEPTIPVHTKQFWGDGG